MRKVIWSAVLMLSSCCAIAQLSPGYMQCVERAKQNTVQVGVCVQKETAFQDARLNSAYKTRLKALKNPTDQQSLKEEERAWIRRRDQQCKIDVKTVDTICVLRETSNRAAQLEVTGDSGNSEPRKQNGPQIKP